MHKEAGITWPAPRNIFIMLTNAVILLFSLRIVSPEPENCRSDFVKVMDGDCVSRLGESKFCGNTVPSKFESTTNRLCIKFYSDDSQNDQGFSASYNAISYPSQQIGRYLSCSVFCCLFC